VHHTGRWPPLRDSHSHSVSGLYQFTDGIEKTQSAFGGKLTLFFHGVPGVLSEAGGFKDANVFKYLYIFLT
jgi:hypothetical protein